MTPQHVLILGSGAAGAAPPALSPHATMSG